ncbi:MAG TPA: hypothetical protein VHZ49_04205 [Methylomirabilota bacterium]|nr:hypothetical protein [Methylomirabilota bacterium]
MKACPLSRRQLIAGGVAVSVTAVARGLAAERPAITVYKAAT